MIVTGLSPEIAQTLVNIGVDLGKMNTVGDLQGGLEEERLTQEPVQVPILAYLDRKGKAHDQEVRSHR